MTKGRINVLLDEIPPLAASEGAGLAKKRRPLASLEFPVKTHGATSAIIGAFEALSEKSKRGEEIEAKFANAEAILEIDPALIDPSFASDRMAAFDPEGTDGEFVAAIRSEGQLVPALLRPNPAAPGRYQPAYGRRRIAAAAFLGRKVRAMVRDLSDEQLVVAQGQENEARNGLTFIEKCRFAATLEEQGYKRKVIMAALTVAETHLSVMLKIVEAIPGSIIDWIGPAPRTGRRRWLELAELAAEPRLRAKMVSAVTGAKNLPAGKSQESDDRFNVIMTAATKPASPKAASAPWALAGQKKPYGSLEITPRRINLMIDRAASPAIAEALLERIDAFRRELEATASANQPKKG